MTGPQDPVKKPQLPVARTLGDVFGLDDIPSRGRRRRRAAPGETMRGNPPARLEIVEDGEQVVVDHILVGFVDAIKVDAVASQPLQAVVERPQDGHRHREPALAARPPAARWPGRARATAF